MKACLNWLREFVDIDLSAAELAEALTMAGLEVETVSPFGHEIKGVVVGQVTEIKPHPVKEELSLCAVTTGARDYQIVCGATNMKAGDKVALALEGAHLAKGVEIKKAKFRGVLSEGMLCSEAELGISDVAHEIIVLSQDAPLGEDLFSSLNLRDMVLDISVNPNRPDCLSILGLAREAGAITGRKISRPEPALVESLPRAEEVTKVDILDPDLCPRYSARLFMETSIGPSPLWMKARLQAVGLRPINNVVDITNYVMMELGQPLHAFDLDLLEDGRIAVKRASGAEMFVTLDGTERLLDSEVLTICDGARPVAIAGVMGGHNSEVHIGTKNILLESAHFHPISIRRTSKKMKLSTEASLRFERGVDPEGTLTALDRAGQLIAALAGGRILAGAVDVYPRKPQSQRINFRTKRCAKILSLDLSSQEIQSILERLELPARPTSEGLFEVCVPSFRFDLKEEIDLIEEVARLLPPYGREGGYDRVPLIPHKSRGGLVKRGKEELLGDKVREVFTAQGYFETINFSFISPAECALFLWDEEKGEINPVELKNPLSQDQSVMRPGLLPGLLGAVRRNIYRDITDLRFFELGRGFFFHKESGPEEKRLLAGVATGMRGPRLWNKEDGRIDFFDVAGVVENLLTALGVGQYQLEKAKTPYFHPGRRSRVLVGDRWVGSLGEVHPNVLKAFDIPQRLSAFEIDLRQLALVMPESFTFRSISRQPFVSRDLAVLVPEEVPVERIKGLILSAWPETIQEVELFDLYQGPPVPPGQKSLAFSLRFQSMDRTLTDQEVQGIFQKIMALLSQEVGAKLR